MIPVVLTTSEGTLTPSEFKRLAYTAAGSEGTLTLYGSNDNVTFDTVEEIDTNVSSDTIITATYKYYKYSATVTMSSVGMYETAFDRPIIYASLAIIFRSFMKEPGDLWDIQRQLAEGDYMRSLDGLKFYLDSNDNQTVDETSPSSFMNVSLVR